MKLFFGGFLALFITIVTAQNNTSYWQQKVDYKMEIDFNVETHQYKGTQKLTSTNNTPDTTDRVFYHFYFLNDKFWFYFGFVLINFVKFFHTNKLKMLK